MRVPAGTYLLDVYADTPAHTIVSASVNGVPVPGGENVTGAAGPWRWGIRYTEPPADGVELCCGRAARVCCGSGR